MKTTNAKARAFQTPAPLQQTAKPEKTLKKASTGRRSVKSKIRVGPSVPVEADILSKDPDSDVPDIEYCPPPATDLPDPPEDITYDEDLPYLIGKNICAGYSEVYDVARDEHGVSIAERKEEESYARVLQQIEDKSREEMAKPWPMEDEADTVVDAMIAAGPKSALSQTNKIDTIRAKGAVSALASRPQTRLPSAATKDTASSMQKKKSISSVLGRKKAPLQPINPSKMRHTAAVAASKTTMGYSKGRQVSSMLPEKGAQASGIHAVKIDQFKIDPSEFRELYGEPPVGSIMWQRFLQHGMFDKEIETDDEDLARQFRGNDDQGEARAEEEEEIFELPMLEEI
jgi:hypothetical protein